MLGFTATIKNAAEMKEWATRLPTEFQRRAFKLVSTYALKIEKEAKLAVPVQTGFLRSSIHSRVWATGKRIFARIGTPITYAPYVEYGTGLYGPEKRKYIIRPRTKKALAFTAATAMDLQSGRMLYRSKTGRLVESKKRAAMIVRRYIIHPGVHPRPYLIPAFARNVGPFRADLKSLAAIKFKDK